MKCNNCGETVTPTKDTILTLTCGCDVDYCDIPMRVSQKVPDRWFYE